MSSYLKSVSKVMPKQEEEEEMGETPKAARKPRGTSSHVQIKVRRDIYEMIGVIAKMNSMSNAEVVEKILETHTDHFREGFNSLKLNSSF